MASTDGSGVGHSSDPRSRDSPNRAASDGSTRSPSVDSMRYQTGSTATNCGAHATPHRQNAASHPQARDWPTDARRSSLVAPSNARMTKDSCIAPAWG